MQSRLPFMIGLLICEVSADILAKEFEIHQTWMRYVCALILYAGGNAVWLLAMKNGIGLAKGTIIFVTLSTMMTLAIAYVRYREPTSIINLIGVGLCVVGLALMDW